MKKAILTATIAAVLLAALASCASIPKPSDENTALVIGNLVLDFPDGFFRAYARTVEDRVRVEIVNKTQQSKFSMYTKDGYFSFLSNGTDEYVLMTYSYETQMSGGGKGSIGGQEIMGQISTTPGKVVYVGHITITYNAPNKSTTLGGGAQTFWNYDVNFDLDWNTSALEEYLATKDPDGTWLSRGIVNESLE
jgi:hypothetical protein